MKGDFEIVKELIVQTLFRPLPGIGWRQTQPSGTWDRDDCGDGYGIGDGNGDDDGDGDINISWPRLRLQRRRNKFFPEFSCCKGSLSLTLLKIQEDKFIFIFSIIVIKIQAKF